MTVKLSQERKVRSLAKKTLGSTRMGRAIRLGGVGRRGWVDMMMEVGEGRGEAGEEGGEIAACGIVAEASWGV